MILWHPEVADRRCEDCQKYFYDDKGARMKASASSEAWMLRASGQKPDCSACPKKSPREAPRIALSEKNRQAYTFCLRAMAAGLPPQWQLDATVRRNLSIVKQLHDRFDRNELAAQVAYNLRALL